MKFKKKTRNDFQVIMSTSPSHDGPSPSKKTRVHCWT